MDVSSISSLTSTSTTSTSSSSSSEIDKTEFLNLLVTQLQYQDPLSPLESQDFAAQLAQYSSLEQLTEINSNLESSVEVDLLLTNSLTNTLSATFIGKEVSAYGDSVTLEDGESATINFKLDAYAENVEVNIYDAAGNLVKTIEKNGFESGMNSITWDGTNNHDASLPSGSYTFEVVATDSNEESIGATTISKGYVSSVRYEDGLAILVVNGQDIDLADVLEIA